MKEGQIIADGSPDVVINRDNLTKIYGFEIILKRHPKEGYTYILPDVAFTGNKLKGEI
jgi:ABC-type hemin transport system ATPase subunit